MKKTVNNYTTYLRESIPIPAAIARYCPELTPRRSRIPCPIHTGRDYNLGFNDSVYHCFVCGAGGDVIHFAQQLFGLKYHEAVEKLDRDFALGLPIGRPASFAVSLKTSQAAANRARKAQRREEQDAAYWALLDQWIHYDRLRVEYTPHSPAFPVDDRYAEAVRNITRIEYRLDNFRFDTDQKHN